MHAGLLLLALAPLAAPDGPEPASGPWRAWLEVPGGELPFGLELARAGDAGWRAELVNGEERIAVSVVELAEGELLLDLPHYDSRVRARVAPDGTELAGTWSKRRGPSEVAELPFRARAGAAPRFPALANGADAAPLLGRWRVDFESEERPAVLVLEAAPAGEARGTILTTTGDYRWLAGAFDGRTLALSCFDGAHAFLLRASLDDDGALAGDFWSGGHWHETWTARRDDAVALDDPYELAHWTGAQSLADLAFPDLEGRLTAVADLAGDATLVVLFGSWCPNCHDEAALLVELRREFGPRGLAVVGLAFELTGDFARDAAQVRRFAERWGADWPLLLAGHAEKRRASAALPALDAVRAFPTTLFVDRDLRVRAVHSGFAGPATGAEHAALRNSFRERIAAMLGEPKRDAAAALRPLQGMAWVAGGTWTEGGGADSHWHFAQGADGHPIARRSPLDWGAPAEELAVRLRGDAVRFGEEPFRFDAVAGVLRSPLDFGRRLSPEGAGPAPLVAARGYLGASGFSSAIEDADPTVRREALAALALGDPMPVDPALLARIRLRLDDPDPGVRVAAAFTWGRLGDAGSYEALEPALASDYGPLRREAARAVRRLAERTSDPAAVARAAALSASPDPFVRATNGD